MKNKLVLFLLCVFGLTATQQVVANEATTNREDVILGGFEDTGIRSIPVVLPVEAFVDDATLFISFDDAVGDVIISVVNEQGETVYEESTTVNAPATTPVYLGASPKGTYHLYIKLAGTNSGMQGEFNID